jgi:DNA-binding LacI/PurR family transcriptional regulator
MDSGPSSRPPVIADVARLAGVSVPTVSRIMTGAAVVSAKKRALVENAIQQLGYRPNGAARALVRGRQQLIAVLSGNTTMYGYAAALQGIEEEAQRSGYLVAITVMGSEEDAIVTSAVDLALGQPVAGVIVIDFGLQGTRALAKLPKTLPVVAVSSPGSNEDVRRVLLDDSRGGVSATEYLLSLGHKTVYHVSLNAESNSTGRMSGWLSALRAAGAPVPEIVESDWTAESGYQAGLILSQIPEATAILCGNDEIAFGVIRALQDSGLAVPEDVSVVGFDDHPHSRYWTPSLTTVAQDFAELGRKAVRLLIDPEADTADSESDTKVLDRLLIRKSSGKPRGA